MLGQPFRLWQNGKIAKKRTYEDIKQALMGGNYMNSSGYVRLPLKNAYNVRDLGGYACDGGGTTCWRAFLRADDLSCLDSGEIEFLLDYGVRTVIDLRSEDECLRNPDPFAKHDGADYLNMPMSFGEMDDVRFAVDSDPSNFLKYFYTGIIDNSQKSMSELLAAMADAREGGILFHCAVGKDRTGIAAMLLLGLAGAADGDIIANYAASDIYLRQSAAYVNLIKADSTADLMLSKPESMSYLLEHINVRYGGIRPYIHSLGLGDKTLEALEARITGR